MCSLIKQFADIVGIKFIGPANIGYSTFHVLKHNIL